MNISSMNTPVFIREMITPSSPFKVKDQPNAVESFGDVLNKALGQVNDLQVQSDKMVQTMITNPDKVNIHEVTTMLSQAEMALSMTKAVTDRVISAYRDITNLR